MLQEDYGKPVLLITVENEIKAEMLLAVLEEQEITAFKKIRGAGAYLSIYMGATYGGVEIYVPEQHVETAREIVDGWSPAADLVFSDDEWINENIDAITENDKGLVIEEDNTEKEKPLLLRSIGRIILWLWLIGLIGGVLWQFGSILWQMLFR